MPELPEVETIKRDLEKEIIGKKIKTVYMPGQEVIKGISPAEFKKILTGATITKIVRRGKLLIFEIAASGNKNIYLTVHLRMTGQLVLGKKSSAARVSFELSNSKFLNYNDERKLGEIHLADDLGKIDFLKNLGPEPLEESFTLEVFKQILNGKSTKIKPLLMDQSFLAGIGNLYAAEILFASRILPERRADTLTDAEIKSIYKNIKKILEQAIACRGSSVDNYRDAKGRQGSYSQHLLVYGRKGKPCVVCKNAIVRDEMCGRGTFYCKVCQR